MRNAVMAEKEYILSNIDLNREHLINFFKQTILNLSVC